MMTDLDLAKKQITWLAAHLRSRIVDERGGGSSTVETLIWIGVIVALVIGVGVGVTAYIRSKMPPWRRCVAGSQLISVAVVARRWGCSC